MADESRWELLMRETEEKLSDRQPNHETFASYLGRSVNNKYQVSFNKRMAYANKLQNEEKPLIMIFFR